MDKIRVRTVAPPERRKLHRLKRQLTNQVNSIRARIILLSSGGIGNREIARLVDRTPQCVRKIIHRFNGGGLAAIEWYPYWQTRGTPRKFLADMVEQIAEVALSSPKALIGMTQWSLSKLREYLTSQRIVPSISLNWLHTLLVRLGIGDTRKLGRSRTILSFGRNTAEFVDFTSVARSVVGGFAWMSLAR